MPTIPLNVFGILPPPAKTPTSEWCHKVFRFDAFMKNTLDLPQKHRNLRNGVII